jgi:hypothetical protein
MSFPLHEAYACSVNPDFLWELSVWMDPEFVAAHAASPERYQGLVRWGMWVARPAVVRQFDSSRKTLADFEPFLRKVMAAVDEVHASPVLASFWRSSDLAPSPVKKTPYEQDIPGEYRRQPRWFALPTDLDPPRPWGLRTRFPVWALARVKEEDGERKWLLLVQSPRGVVKGVRVRVPGWGTASVDAAPEGRFYLLREGSPEVEALLSPL